MARALYLDLTGQRVPTSPSVEGRTFIAEFHDVAASHRYFRRGKLTLREWLQTFRGPWELAWFSRDDPIPFVMMGVRLMFRAFERLLRRQTKPAVPKNTPRFDGRHLLSTFAFRTAVKNGARAESRLHNRKSLHEVHP